MEKTITVIFKETYLPFAVKRTCSNMSKEEIIKVYGLLEDDISWYKFIDEEEEN